METPIFVYGSLRKGFQNNYKLNSAEFKGLYYTKKKYYMIGAKSGSYPYVVAEKLHETLEPTHIYGELYLVSNDLLRSLDEMEGHPVHYKRQFVEIIDDAGHTEHAQMYILENEELKTDIGKSFERRFLPVNDGNWKKCASS
jgi:gamma-glutamylaminecyclotransferase